MKNEHLKAIIITSFGVLLMSFESLLIKLAQIDAMLFSFYAGFFMFISLNFILYKRQTISLKKTYTTNLSIVILCGITFGISNIFFINAIKTTTVANVVMIFASAPLFAAFYSYLIYNNKSKINIYITSFFIFIGLLIIFSSQLGGGDFLGNLYALLCTNFFALSFVILSQYAKVNRFSVIAVAGLSSMFITLFFIDDFALDINTLVVLLIAGLFVSPISRVLMGLGAKTLPASEVSILMIIETIMAPVWVWIVLNEIPADSTFVGGSIILVALFLNSLYVLRTNKK